MESYEDFSEANFLECDHLTIAEYIAYSKFDFTVLFNVDVDGSVHVQMMKV